MHVISCKWKTPRRSGVMKTLHQGATFGGNSLNYGRRLLNLRQAIRRMELVPEMGELNIGLLYGCCAK